MNVLLFPDKALLTKCEEVTDFSDIGTVSEEMYQCMKSARGMGLSANQVGILKRFFVMSGPSGEKICIVNPKILRQSLVTLDLSEGCLSAPGQQLKLFRPAWVEISFQNEKGELLKETFAGEHSVCVQHEIEHLDGKSFMHNKAIPKKLRIFLAKKWGIPR